MPSFEMHVAESIEKFGKGYSYVHIWLDEFAGKPPHGMNHRKFRHHLAGINEVRRLWGLEASLVARAHIIADLKMEGWVEHQGIPKDMDDYIARGLF